MARRVLDVLLPPATGLFLTLPILAHRDLAQPWGRLAALLIALATGLVLYRRRSHPRTVAALTVAGSAVVQVTGPEGLFPWAGLIAMWTLATRYPPRTSLPVLAALLGVTALSLPSAPPGDVPFAMGVGIAVWALAEATRSRRAAILQASRQAAEREQARLARELHDVIAHSVSVIVIQAAAGDDVFDADPAAARRALRSIESAGRDALAELRRLLAAIGSPPDPADRSPQPDLDRLGDLADPLRTAGLEVAIQRVDDGRTAVPAGVQLSAYRIVQEALTNAVRHAQATRVDVRIEARETLLEVTVTDDGPPVPAGEPGLGIAGMHQRAALLGGTLEAGPRPDGGFRVRARLPMRVPG